ncbi:MAG: arginine--tRNA ligase [Kiritimatiellae bacterium]|nr:arginine--tRNA ligase [Kiritimatiellia bacterium]
MKDTIEQQLSDWIKRVFTEVFPGEPMEGLHLDVVPTSNEKFGDYQCNATMALAKQVKKKPRDIAETVVHHATLPENVERLEIAGPGFINIFLNTSWMSTSLEKNQQDPDSVVPQPGARKTVIIDYSSPNIAKPMHIGHIRSTVIGNALDRIYRYLGYTVIADNHLGDWGTQFGLLIMGYRHFLNETALEEHPIEELERIYVKSYEKSKQDDAWLDQAREELVKLQQGDPTNKTVWEEFVQLSLGEFEHIYKRLSISFDLVRGESFYNENLPETMNQLKDLDLLKESEGAQVVFLEEEKLPVCIVKKRDGGFNYATTDLATITSRVKEFEPDRVIYVTDERQQLHFNQIFTIAKKMGIKTKLVHIWFGLMQLPEGTFSTREGHVIKLERLLDEAETRALEIVQTTSPNMNANQQKEVARAVGIGAIKYADLSQNPQSLVTFTWEKALSLDGHSAPYLQYAYARIASIKDKYAEQFPAIHLDDYPIRLEDPLERRLGIKLIRFQETVHRAAKHYRPNFIADYLYDLAQTYSAFYQNVPFLKAKKGVRESRIRLCTMVGFVLGQGLDLLGIETPKRI